MPVPSLASVAVFAAVVAAASFAVLWRLRLNILWVIGASALAGILRVLIS